jgi:opacity protein-like surface antigen
MAALLLPATAHAADGNPFAGPHGALLVGWDDFGYDNPNPDIDFEKNLSDVAFGFSAGWDFGVSPEWIIGIDSSLLFSDNKDVFFDDVQVNPLATTPDRLEVKANHDWDIGLRIGYVINNAALFYVKGAYANTGLKAILVQNDIETKVGEGEDGWRIGVGAEVMIWGPIFLTAEYRYTGYGHGLDRNQILGGVGVRFGGSRGLVQ